MIVVVVPVLLASAVTPVQAADNASADLTVGIRKDLDDWLGKFPTRLAGSGPQQEALQRLKDEIDAIAAGKPNIWVAEQTFPVVIPSTVRDDRGPALTITRAGQSESFTVYPIWPASARLNTTPAEGISGRLVYVGQGRYEDLPPAELRGQIAVMEMTGGANWRGVYNFGAAAIVLLGSTQESQRDAQSHLIRMPLNVPRFYVPATDTKLQELLRAAPTSGEKLSGRLYCKGRWVQSRGRNFYVLVRTADFDSKLRDLETWRAAEAEKCRGDESALEKVEETYVARQKEFCRQALAFLVPTDGMSVVPDLAPGADAAVDESFGLNLLRYYAAHPPGRPLLFAFVDAYAINMTGVREMLSALAVTGGDREYYADEDDDLKETYEKNVRLADEVNGPAGAEPRLDPLRGRRFAPLHQYVKDEVARQVVAIEFHLFPLRLRQDKLPPGEEKAKLEEEVRRLETERQDWYAAQSHLISNARIEATDPARVERILALEKDLWARTARRARGQLDETLARIQVIADKDALRKEMLRQLGLTGSEPSGRRSRKGERSDQPLNFVMGLDLSDGGVAVGMRQYCHFYGVQDLNISKNFRTQWLIPTFRTEKIWTAEQMDYVVDNITRTQDPAESYSVGAAATLTSACDSFATAGVTWATLDGFRHRVDTPQDRVERLDWGRLAPQIDATFTLIRRLAARPDFEHRSNLSQRWVRACGTIVDQSPGEPVPRVPMQRYLVTLVNGSVSGQGARLLGRPWAEGVRFDEFRFTGTDGMFFFDSLPSLVLTSGGEARSKLFVQAYRIDDDGQITRAIDMNKIGRGVKLDWDLTAMNPGPRRATVFTCEATTLLELFDPRFLLYLPSATVLDAHRAGKPLRMNYALYQGQMGCLLEPSTRWELILRAGTTQNRMALLDMAGEMRPDDAALVPDGKSIREAMVGFNIRDRLWSIPMHVAARDFSNLDQRRLNDYGKAGIKSKAVSDICDRTRELLAAANAAAAPQPPEAPPQGAELFKAASGAMANEVRAYQAIQSLANDVIRAAIFLLLVLVPFSFALERLIFAHAHIYRQLATIGIIFAIMTAILWSFHPAFRISNQPLMIIMAFGIIFMSLLVISIVYQKFKSQLEEMRSGRAESSGARTSRGGLAVSAVKLGIANMRKRKLRTALTGTTIVLITFALLCFTSVSNYVGQKEMTLTVTSPFTGALVRQPQGRGMPLEALRYVESIVGQSDEVVPLFWWANSWSTEWCIHVRRDVGGGAEPPTAARGADAGQIMVSAKAALGLSAGEDRLTGIGRILPHWDQFIAKSPGACYLPQTIARALGVARGDRVVVAGKSLEVIDVFDEAQLDNDARTMIGERITPTDYRRLGEQQRNLLASTNLEQLASEVASGAGMEPDMNVGDFLTSAEVLILPASMLIEMSALGTISLRSIAINADSRGDLSAEAGEARAQTLAKELADRLAFPVYFGGRGQRVHAVAAMALTPTAPKSMLIMLVIAGLIIFNTMLNSIAERKKEIHIYTSLGLAPLHVGVLFMAEAITYGLMGSIFGYIVGQGIATALSNLGWMGGVTLNYSGTQAIATMMMVLVVVVLSALVPAFMAGKLAAPSEVMKWHVPRPDGEVIRDTLPFTVTNQTAAGVAMFLHDYMDAHREGSIGHFSTDRLELIRQPGPDGRDLLGVAAVVWLAPYDLGVRQDVRLLIRPTGESDVLEIDVELTRGAGHLTSWWKLNRVFLGDLRKQLLGWRKLKTARVLEYIEAGAEALTRPPAAARA